MQKGLVLIKSSWVKPKGSCALHYNIAIATLLTGLGNDGRRKRLKPRPQSFNLPQPKAARSLPILHRVLVLPK